MGQNCENVTGLICEGEVRGWVLHLQKVGTLLPSLVRLFQTQLQVTLMMLSAAPLQYWLSCGWTHPSSQSSKHLNVLQFLPGLKASLCAGGLWKLLRVMRGGCVPISSSAASWLLGWCEHTGRTCVSTCLCVCVCTVWVLRTPLAANATALPSEPMSVFHVCVMDTAAPSIRAFFPMTDGLVGRPAGGAWPVCPHVCPSVSGLSLERCGVKDGEPGRCTAIKWWHGWGACGKVEPWITPSWLKRTQSVCMYSFCMWIIYSWYQCCYCHLKADVEVWPTASLMSRFSRIHPVLLSYCSLSRQREHTESSRVHLENQTRASLKINEPTALWLHNKAML